MLDVPLGPARSTLPMNTAGLVGFGNRQVRVGADGSVPGDFVTRRAEMSEQTEHRADDDHRVDEEFRSLLEGLRTSLPGVQVLFAFLLTAPLSGRFDELDQHDKVAFSVAFYSAGIASVLLIAPSVHQRVRAPFTGLRRRSKSHLIWTTWVAIIGSVVMGVAVAATVYLVSRLVHSGSPAIAATAAIVAIMIWAWFYLPLITFQRVTDDD